jgi:hypothetical protein
MKFNDTTPMLSKPQGPPPWLPKLAENATFQAAALKGPVEGRDKIIGILKEAFQLYEFQNYYYHGEVAYDGPAEGKLFLTSYGAQIQGTPIDCAVWVHLNAAGEADSVVVNHYPLTSALLFSRLMWERVGDRFGDLYLTGPQAEALEAAGFWR